MTNSTSVTSTLDTIQKKLDITREDFKSQLGQDGFVLEVFVFLEQQIIQDHIQLKLNV
jgi:hypothetical protein